MTTEKIKQEESIIFATISKIVVGLLALFCVLPFMLVVSGSFSSEDLILKNGYSIIPQGFSFAAYRFLIESPKTILNAYGISLLVTISSVTLSLLLISSTAYVLFRKDFKYRNAFSFFFYFTTLFNGGLLPFYILMIRYLQLKDSLLALIVTGLFNVFFLLVMRNFIKGAVPESLIEAAKIDGAGDFLIYWKIILPLIKAGLVTIALFEAIAKWNNWVDAMLYISKSELYPLQFVLNQILQSSQAQSQSMMESSAATSGRMPSETFKLAMTVVATGPIFICYPFLQKYFMQGVTVGAVKE